MGTVKLAIFPENNSDAGTMVNDPGEICISGPSVTMGYQDNETANKSAFFIHQGQRWFRTGDRGMLDSYGTLAIVGRISE